MHVVSRVLPLVASTGWIDLGSDGVQGGGLAPVGPTRPSADGSGTQYGGGTKLRSRGPDIGCWDEERLAGGPGWGRSVEGDSVNGRSVGPSTRRFCAPLGTRHRRIAAGTPWGKRPVFRLLSTSTRPERLRRRRRRPVRVPSARPRRDRRRSSGRCPRRGTVGTGGCQVAVSGGWVLVSPRGEPTPGRSVDVPVVLSGAP